jgi:N-sulfoglucosamine sulfohydrolase
MNSYNRRQFLRYTSMTSAALLSSNFRQTGSKPNILLLMSDNQSWNHLGCYGDPVVRTPHIDHLAETGVRFTHAFCAAPSCAPARGGMLTGQDIWRLGEGANLWGILPNRFPLYTDLLARSGYHVGCQGKGWGPGNVEMSGRQFNHGGHEFTNFEDFLKANTSQRPWCFWFSSRNPHRPYTVGSGTASGMDPGKVRVPGYLPDVPAVRSDICDYYFEIEQFDKEVEHCLATLRQSGEYEKTLIVVCSDNGWQMPRGLANLYDFGTRVPLIFSWAGEIAGGRVVGDFVNLNDLAPTFLQVVGLQAPKFMTANSLADLLFSRKSGQTEPQRDCVITARERHALCRRNGLGYPGRSIRTADFLYIRNYEPERWPAGDPPLFGDVDAHMLHYPCPTKMHMLQHRDERGVRDLFELAFSKRPAEELFDVRKDPDLLRNLASMPAYDRTKKDLSERLDRYLRRTGDPRLQGGELIWDTAMYYQPRDFMPKPGKEAIEALGLKEEYDYFSPGPW